jgi:hypothetical protein
MKTTSSMKRVLFTMTLLVSASLIQAQPPEIEWFRCYGGDNSDEAYCVQQTTDGGYVFAGYTKSFNADSNDVYLVKTDSLGNVEWYRLYGGADYDVAYSVQQTLDGGYIVAGLTCSFGSGNSDIYVIRTNNLGDTLWTRTYGGAHYEEARSVEQTSDGGHIIAGRKEPYGGALTQMYLVKTDSLGDTLWTRSYGGIDNREAYSAQETQDRGFVVIGCNPIWGGVEYSIYVVKIDSVGNTLWTQVYGDSSGATSIRQTSDGGYIIAGWILPVSANQLDVYLVKTDSLGDTLWTRTYGQAGSDYGYSVQQTPDDGYIVAGTAWTLGTNETNIYLIKTDSTGDTLWTLIYVGSDSEYGVSLDQSQGRGYIVGGSIWTFIDPPDCWLLKTGPDTVVSGAPSIEAITHPRALTLHPAYPNPFNPVTTISYEVPVRGIVRVDVYNVLGRKTAELVHDIASAGRHCVRWDAGELPSGVYFVRLSARTPSGEAGEFHQTRKVVLLK